MLIKTLNRLKIPLLTVFAVLMFCSPNFSQTSDLKTAPKSETVVASGDTVSFLIRQNENARSLMAAQENRIRDLETENEALAENSDSISKSYESAKSEIASLQSSNQALARAAALNEQTITLLQAENATQKDKAKRATKQKFTVLAAAAGVIILKLLIP